MKKLILDCQKCGGLLEIFGETELFKCQYCGTPYLVKRDHDSIRVVVLEERVSLIEKRQEEHQAKISLFELEAIQKRISQIITENHNNGYSDKQKIENYINSDLLGKVKKYGCLVEVCKDTDDYILSTKLHNPYPLIDALSKNIEDKDGKIINVTPNAEIFVYEFDKSIYTINHISGLIEVEGRVRDPKQIKKIVDEVINLYYPKYKKKVSLNVSQVLKALFWIIIILSLLGAFISMVS